MKTLQVALGERSYPLLIGSGLLSRVAELLPGYIIGQQICIVTNRTVAPLYLPVLLPQLNNYQTVQVILPDGEQFKDLATLNLIFDELLKHRFERRCTLLALGGGVVGDMTGFAAACYQRGAHFIQLPTTLLAQVDSSVGGKTAVNHPLGKNMIGAFHQPNAVLADTDTLKTLSDRELRAGLAEVIKTGLLRDEEFFNWLEKHLNGLLQRDPDVLIEAIARSCRNKADIVAEDERESGIRALLNLGHTFGHAIEVGLGYGVWLHGEAVAAGICLAADLSRRLGWLSDVDQDRIRSVFQHLNLPVALPNSLTVDGMLGAMSVDKKVSEGRLRLVLLKAIGEAVVVSDVEPSLLRETLSC